jgi:hypothetical protein
VPTRRAPEVPGLAREGPRDDSTDARSIGMPPRNLTELIEALNRKDAFMRGDLQNRIR